MQVQLACADPRSMWLRADASAGSTFNVLTQQVGAAAMDTTPLPPGSGTQRSHLGLSSPLGQVHVLRGPKLHHIPSQMTCRCCTGLQQHCLNSAVVIRGITPKYFLMVEHAACVSACNTTDWQTGRRRCRSRSRCCGGCARATTRR